MSDAVNEELVEITVDGQPLQARKGAMLIEATDQAGIDVPRFCYHRKLSVAANCRMCLVDVEKAPKPLPACATPIMPGMVVHTRSERALDAQKSTMEFLLINHPLDCPICDQGGECELQDQAMGYGSGVSQYSETKRVVFDKYIGPLISTEMTRCIHCTRCVRFGEEIAGLRELGMTGRGENSRIGTFIEKSVASEMSGNVIDLCPVGALTAKPSRYTARPWELTQHASVAPHDSMGSNIYIHSRRGDVMRVVPRDNESINEAWISDRDRFSYEAINSKQRLLTPMLKKSGEWQSVEWDEALSAAAEAIAASGDQLGTLISPIATLEEQYLAQKITRALGSNNIDHRLRQRDFSDQQKAPIMPWLGMPIDAIDTLDAALLIGSNPRKEQPIAAHRLRKSALKGAQISFLNTRAHAQQFDTCVNMGVHPYAMVAELMAIANALGADISHVSGARAATISPQHQRIADSLKKGEKTWVVLGNSAVSHSDFSALRALAQAIAMSSDAVFGYLPEAGNTAGAWLSGCVPHRSAAGNATSEPEGKHAADMLEHALKAYLLLAIDPDMDSSAGAAAVATLGQADALIALTSFDSEALRECASIMLPVATFAETSGTFVNAAGSWQSFKGAVAARGESRPAWKVLRVLANHLNIDGFDYLSSDDVRGELKQHCLNVQLDNKRALGAVSVSACNTGAMVRTGDVPIYASDPLTRRAAALQRTADANPTGISLSPGSANAIGLNGADEVVVTQQGATKTLSVTIDTALADGCAWIPMGMPSSAALGAAQAEVALAPGQSTAGQPTTGKLADA